MKYISFLLKNKLMKLILPVSSSVIVFGALTIGLSFLAEKFTDKVIQATQTIWGVIGGPLAGIFIMGFYMPFCNSAVSRRAAASNIIYWSLERLYRSGVFVVYVKTLFHSLLIIRFNRPKCY